MSSTLTFAFTKLFQFQFRTALCYTNTCPVVSLAALSTLKPDILPFALPFSHKVFPTEQARLLEKHILSLKMPNNLDFSEASTFTFAPLLVTGRGQRLFRDAQARIFVTTPAPTVLPPSRIAKRRPSSIAIGEIISTSIVILSPGIHISALLPSRLINE